MKPEQGKGSTTSTSTSSGQNDLGKSFRHGRETVEFSVKGPMGVSIDEHLSNSGCAVLDLVFAEPSQVGEIVFRNYYTMWLSILVKIKSVSTNKADSRMDEVAVEKPACEKTSDWLRSIARKVIMQNPHYETGSQDIISIASSESEIEWKNLVAMRIILRQPSPVWKTFHIEEINVYKDLPRRGSIKETAAESLMMLIKRQTIASLKWAPPTTETSGNSSAYEFKNLPQP